MTQSSEELTEAEARANCATWEHIDTVRRMLRVLAVSLLERGETHDRSKLVPPESSMFAEFTPKLRGMTYGSDEYKACLTEMGPALRHHYDNNRHHPEHYDDGIRGMTLVDLVEMWADWWASCQRHADGNLEKSIEINRSRFNMSDDLVAIFRNTAQAMPEHLPMKKSQRLGRP